MRTFSLILVLSTLLSAPAGALPGKTYYQQRRAKLAAWMKPGSLLIIGLGKQAHNTWSNKYFYYLTGIHNQNSVLLLYKNQDGRARSLICFQPRSASQERWDGVRPYPDAKTAERLGVMGAVSLKDLRTLLPQLMPLVTALYYDAKRFPHQSLATLIATERARHRSVAQHSPYGQLVGMRQVKDALELKYLQKAIDITGCALLEAMRSAQPGIWEHELEAVIQYLFRRNGADKALAFESIVGSGPNSCVLHYNASTRRTRKGELVVLDVGAQYRGYAADVTRTIPISGTFSKRQREIYQIVLRAQKAAIAAVRPGVTLRQIHAVAMRVIQQAGYGRYFIHGTSHWLGLDVHDVGHRVPLRPGMVLTVEPGIYIPAENLGVRIEDDVLVTQKGAKVLSGWIPKETAEVERWIAKGGGIGRIRREIEKQRLDR